MLQAIARLSTSVRNSICMDFFCSVLYSVDRGVGLDGAVIVFHGASITHSYDGDWIKPGL